MSADPVRLIIITVPPDEACERIDAFRREVGRIGDTREALTYPPHVTLRTGALVPPDQLADYADRLALHLAGWQPFPVDTEGLEQSTYDAGGRMRHFVGYRIAASERLMALNRRLLSFRDWIKSDRTEFEPHLTVAFHDLDDAGANRVADWIEAHPDRVPGRFQWVCDNVGLWCRAGTQWQAYRVIRLN